jgi:4-hydroxybenzoate polyprenyltransferase
METNFEHFKKRIAERMPHYWALIRGDKPVGILLLLWPTWWALWLASSGMPSLKILFIFTAGVWLTRSAGCIINDYADRWLDGQVKRTQHRPLASGTVSSREALLLFCLLMLLAFALVWFTNPLTIGMSVIAIFLAASYPFLKRYTYLPQVYLGLAFGWGIPMAFTAIQGKTTSIAWLLFCANLLWTTAYDTWYAMVDRDDDIRAGAKSTAILFGDADLIAQAVLYLGFLTAMILLGRKAELGINYYLSLVVAACFIAWQFHRAKTRVGDDCFAAFLNNQWVGCIIFIGIALDFLLKTSA